MMVETDATIPADVTAALSRGRDHAVWASEDNRSQQFKCLVDLMSLLTREAEAHARLRAEWSKASVFVRGIIEACGFEPPPLESRVDLEALRLDVIGQIEEGKAAEAALAAMTAERDKLNSCNDNQRVTIVQQRTALATLRAEVQEAIPLLRCVRALDCGAHYCRYCPAKSPKWEHGPSCPYVESQRISDAARVIAGRLAALIPTEET